MESFRGSNVDEDSSLPSMKGGIRVDVVTIALSPSLDRVTEWGFGAVVVPLALDVDGSREDTRSDGLVRGERTLLLVLS